MMSASVRRNRACGYWVAPMEAGMWMRCWILLVFVMVVPVEGKVSFWDHQTPGWNLLWGSNEESLCAHLEYLALAIGGKKGRARQVDSSDTWMVSTFYGASESK